jgi:hypothetical protein
MMAEKSFKPVKNTLIAEFLYGDFMELLCVRRTMLNAAKASAVYIAFGAMC